MNQRSGENRCFLDSFRLERERPRAAGRECCRSALVCTSVGTAGGIAELWSTTTFSPVSHLEARKKRFLHDAALAFTISTTFLPPTSISTPTAIVPSIS